MSKEYSECPNCGAKIKSSMLSTNLILRSSAIELIRLYTENLSETYCQKCGTQPFNESWAILEKEIKNLSNDLLTVIQYLPVITSHNPLGWDYDVLDMVTAQSVGGTGIFAEVSSSIDDLFGAQSGVLSNKLRKGENVCFGMLRKRALDIGGNAVIGTDIDYSELGAIKGMIMVCMAGTSVRLKNHEILGDERVVKLAKLTETNAKLRKLSLLKADLE